MEMIVRSTTAALIVAISLCPIGSISGQGASTDSLAVAKTHSQWFGGLRAADTVALAAVLAPTVSFGFATGQTANRDGFLRMLHSGRLHYTSIVEEEQQIRCHGLTAVVTGRALLTYRIGQVDGSEHVTYTATYVVHNQQWKMLAWQSTLIPAP